MRGGKRENAGRKGYGPTKIYRLPIALDSQIQALVDDYKANFDSVTQSKNPSFESVTESKSHSESVTQSKTPAQNQAKNTQVIVTESDSYIEAMKHINKMNKNQRQILIKKFGSLKKAAMNAALENDTIPINQP